MFARSDATPCAAATSELEHAVSTDAAAPPSPSACASLPTMNEGPQPATAAGASDGTTEEEFPSLLFFLFPLLGEEEETTEVSEV